METNAVRPTRAMEIVSLKPTAFYEHVANYLVPQPGNISDGGKARIYFNHELQLFLKYREEARDGAIKPGMSWLEYHERWKAKTNGTPLDKEKIKAHYEFLELKKAGKIAENVWFTTWLATR
ncbi:hypothetical protein [Pseudorhodoplanes sp.]|uniref:hypothetical protein n=1 Tax=Pseudorhodoplanes sp. TaxID=1934341 RepID=UPI003D0ACAB2